MQQLSRPTRACGLKLKIGNIVGDVRTVTPHTGVWIETASRTLASCSAKVTPHTGVWIETRKVTKNKG